MAREQCGRMLQGRGPRFVHEMSVRCEDEIYCTGRHGRQHCHKSSQSYSLCVLRSVARDCNIVQPDRNLIKSYSALARR